jgi:hypothetical protein
MPERAIGNLARRSSVPQRPNVGALAFKRSGDPNLGIYGNAMILKTFGEVPENLNEL